MNWPGNFVENVFEGRNWWITISLMINGLILAFVSVAACLNLATGNTFFCYSMAFSCVLASLSGLIGFYDRAIGPRTTAGILIGQALMAVMIFALTYDSFGSTSAGTPMDFSSALYFSVVTWTTLGYGDITAPTDIRLVAAAQAMLGYLFLGLIVGILASDMGKVTQENKSPDA
jgi:hypothetical protein